MAQCYRHLWFGCVAYAFIAGVGAPLAQAQSAFGSWNENPAWLDDRERAEGPGLRAGDLELHPGVGAEVGWDSNVYYEESNPQDSAVLRVSPHLLLTTLNQQRMDEAEADELPGIVFSAGLSGSLYHYFIDEARDNLSAAGELDLHINPKRPFSLRLYDQFSRTIRPFTQAVRGGNPYNFGRNRNVVGVEASLFSRGNIIGGTLGYSFGIDIFDDNVFQFGNSLQHTISGNASWRFLPETALVYETNLYLTNYSNPNDVDATSLLVDNERYHSRLGINGALTQQLSFSVFGGYAVGFYAVAEEYDGLTALAELRWRPKETLTLAAGYDRDYFTSFIGNFYSRDRGYTRLELFLGGSVLLGFEGDVGYYDYGVTLQPDGTLLGNTPSRDDIRVTGRLFAEYRLRSWVAVTASLAYTSSFTDFTYRVDGPAGVIFDPAKYNKFEAWLGTRVFF
ncbi:MAG: outer membrane beta-barrel protein [Myxococcales bacterium]|nr:outer membrane beta-barrel protein [Myxococcales bacterium]MCB9708780.1 outer membrane beta-barrel protein [Myxococcales bacterium]